MAEEGYRSKSRQVWRTLLLGLALTWVAVASACASAGSSAPDEGAGEELPPSPTPYNTASQDNDPGEEEAHRYYDEARRMALQGKWEEAITGYSQAIILDTMYWAAYEGRAAAYHALGKHEEAIKDYDRSLVIQQDSRLYMERGHSYLEVGGYIQADQDYHLALALGLTSPTVYTGMGDAHRAIGELEEAARSYSDALALDPDSWQAYYFRGVCYFRLRQFQQALEDFERVITLQPHDAGAYFARGAIRWLDGQCTDALEDFEAFVALSDDGEALSQAWEHIEHLKGMVQCEPPPDIPLLV